MTRIRILSEAIANQIAAGEVVERPASVVKELVENALDAGAENIEVEVRGAGRTLIRVDDDGCGMSREDALLAFERHATSKIGAIGDLDRLASYGFRGEALPSIASVSHCTLRTRERGQAAGTEVAIDGGRLLHVRDCGRAVGTSFEVVRLFHNVPARRKFLKADSTESAHILQCMRMACLARPQVAFALISEGRQVLKTGRCANLRQRVGEVFGRDLADSLLEVDECAAGWRLTGLMGGPAESRPSRHEMTLFINGRPVDSRALGYAVIEGYREWLARERFPVVFLNLECDPSRVDVNVHPSKREVRFREESLARAFVASSVAARLHRQRPAASSAPVVPAPLEPAPPANAAPAAAAAVEESAPQVPSSHPPMAAQPGHLAPPWKFLASAGEGIALFEAPDGIVVLDTACAQERIGFEQLLVQFREGSIPLQRLLAPEPFNLGPLEAALAREHADFLRRHGFEAAEFGGAAFRLESVPAWMDPGAAESFFRELLAAIREGALDPSRPERGREELARLAAIRIRRREGGGDATRATRLVADLFATAAPHTTPSGRSTYFEISRGELARRLRK